MGPKADVYLIVADVYGGGRNRPLADINAVLC